jgi:hypothetical protein
LNMFKNATANFKTYVEHMNPPFMKIIWFLSFILLSVDLYD